jgi:hypothetical protein
MARLLQAEMDGKRNWVTCSDSEFLSKSEIILFLALEKVLLTDFVWN